MITLIGFMGCGKTTVGAELARRTGTEAVDVDAVIEEREGRPVSRIFAEDGEAKFRELERRMVAELCGSGRPMVLCSGGGVVLEEANVRTIRSAGPVVWLRATPESICRRISGDGSRPLLAGALTPQIVSDRLEPRLPLYAAAADIAVDTDDKTAEEICREIEEALATLGRATPLPEEEN